MTAIIGSQAVSADPVLEWNEIMMTAYAGQNPVNDARLAAITQLAVFEAVNATTREYQPYLGSVLALPGASTEAAAIAAAHAVIRAYAPQHQQMLSERREASLAAIANGPAKEAGIAVGEAAAAAMLALRANDGSAPAETHIPTSTAPGEWQLTPGCTSGALAHWRHLMPFGIGNPRHFRLDPPPALQSTRYARALNEIKRVGGVNSDARPKDRADVAQFYAVMLPVRVWNPVVKQVAIAQGRSLTHTARALALVNMAMSDAFIGVFDAKYRYRMWRPVTAIRNAHLDGNFFTVADPDFTPFVTTPCHPSYASAHASSSYAARAVLDRIYGKRGHFITMPGNVVPGVNLQYTSFEQITRDIDDARIYGGIHFRFDQEAGAQLGEHVGSHVYRENLVCLRNWSDRNRGVCRG
jgi:hypothetical protein